MPVKRRRGFPNALSERRTPASVMIDAHYENLQIVERWSWVRYVRLCKFLQLTPFELASLVAMPHESVDDLQAKSRLRSRSVALLLTLVEAYVMAKWTDDVIKNPFPNLSHERPEGT